MNYSLLLFAIVFISCKNNQTKTQAGAETDTIITEKNTTVPTETNSSPSLKDSEILFAGLPGFLPRNFDDTVQVRNIQQYVNHIEQQKFKDSFELENEDFMENMTDGGGSLTGYFQNGKLVKIAEWYGLSWGVLQATFYLKNDKLAFVKETEDHFYIDSTGTDPSRFDTRFKGEYYFDNDRLFDEVSVGHNRFEIDENDAGKEYPERSRKNRKIILDHRNKK